MLDRQTLAGLVREKTPKSSFAQICVLDGLISIRKHYVRLQLTSVYAPQSVLPETGLQAGGHHGNIERIILGGTDFKIDLKALARSNSNERDRNKGYRVW
jgi:hypothetical protein